MEAWAQRADIWNHVAVRGSAPSSPSSPSSHYTTPLATAFDQLNPTSRPRGSPHPPAPSMTANGTCLSASGKPAGSNPALAKGQKPRRPLPSRHARPLNARLMQKPTRVARSRPPPDLRRTNHAVDLGLALAQFGARPSWQSRDGAPRLDRIWKTPALLDLDCWGHAMGISRLGLTGARRNG